MAEVKLYYFDDYGRYMTMKSRCDDIITLPITVRYYPRFESSTSQIGNCNDIPLDYNKHKKSKEKFTWYNLTLSKRTNEGTREDWCIEGLNDPGYITPDAFPVVHRELSTRFNYWFNKHCDIRNYWKHPEMYHLGHTCYWNRVVIKNVSNVTAHIYGKSICLSKTLKNVMLIVHDDIEIIEDTDYDKYKDKISAFESNG